MHNVSFIRDWHVWAKAFQEDPIAYDLKDESGSASTVFSIDSSGYIALMKKLDYAYDPRQYRLNVTATETASGFKSSTLVGLLCNDILY